MKQLLLLVPLLTALTQCAVSVPQTGTTRTPLPSTSSSNLPQITNVSAYDPKERQREGRGYTEHDVSALRANGSVGLIARAGKGGVLDTKCANFLAAADRVGMLPGIYYRVQKHVSPIVQADQFVNRAQALARSRAWNTPALLLCGDYDGDLPLSSIIRFMDRVHARTGVVPIAYLENSAQLKRTLSNADSLSKAKLRAAPYWLALYSHTNGADNPQVLLGQYNVWNRWAMWQYGGVDWERGRSRPKVYNNGPWRFTPYFGNMDRPVERNVFAGSLASLHAMWQRHGIRLQ